MAVRSKKRVSLSFRRKTRKRSIYVQCPEELNRIANQGADAIGDRSSQLIALQMAARFDHQKKELDQFSQIKSKRLIYIQYAELNQIADAIWDRSSQLIVRQIAIESIRDIARSIIKERVSSRV